MRRRKRQLPCAVSRAGPDAREPFSDAEPDSNPDAFAVDATAGAHRSF